MLTLSLRSPSPTSFPVRPVGAAHGGKSPAQVALNWLLYQGALPIPGAKNARQVAEISGARGWRITADEAGKLSAAASDLQGVGAPFENW